MKVGIIDTGNCSIRSLEYAFKKLGVTTGVVSSNDSPMDFDRFVLPGVGSFDFAVESIIRRNLWDLIRHLGLIEKKPILGICLGMQLFADSSEEGDRSGLGLIKGKVLKIRPDNEIIYKVPNAGWSHIVPTASPFTDSYPPTRQSPRFYFVHSYHLVCEDQADIAMLIQLDKSYCAAVISGNIWGAQFHPEKSHNFGLEFLRIWLES